MLATIGRDITTTQHLHHPRRHRSYPRVVKRMRHNGYRVKKPYDTGTRHTGPPVIKLTNRKINLS